MFNSIQSIIEGFHTQNIPQERKAVLAPLVAYINSKIAAKEIINLNFICTHNSRRSHLSQIWAQTMAFYFQIPNIYCYSGGTEATAVFEKVIETLTKQGFQIESLAGNSNPVYMVKFTATAAPIIAFSKKYQHAFNPSSQYAAVVTCNSANEACPVVLGAETRIPIMYNDPKAFDNTPEMDEKYKERSLEIAQELWYVFSLVSSSKE